MKKEEQDQNMKIESLSISTEETTNISIIRKMLNKVPEVTIFFWIIKIMTTTVGETAADFLNFNLHWGLTRTTVVMIVLLLVTLLFQFRSRKYIPGIYWLVVTLVSVVGTLVSDNLVDHIGISLQVTTTVFALALLVTFTLWYGSEKTLSIHSIYTIKREIFYWATIFFTFALGTAAGDLISEGLDLGYWRSAFMFASLIGIVTIAYYGFKFNAVWSFWMAYIVTRPLGASLGDYLSQSHADGGLGLGTAGTSVIFLVTILTLVIYLAKSGIDQTQPSS
ncbi:membrane protein [Paenibacillus terrae]|uniref:Membrane protein n=1 Tax=Paenibacillus terrae TaxID=159743 RepID=A0A0D7X316_9BACL|nr:membrane protein [Paenibacillus terrae]KJD45805.1 membrane protein [Paenibacillus terrae]